MFAQLFMENRVLICESKTMLIYARPIYKEVLCF